MENLLLRLLQKTLVSGSSPLGLQASRLRPPTSSLACWIVFAFLGAPCVLFYAYVGSPVLLALSLAAVLCVSPLFRVTIVDTGVWVVKDGRTLSIICATAAFTLTLVGGEGRIFPATADWLIRDAVLRDLVLQAWPVTYRVDGQNWDLRAPLGMYLVPALVGKLFGLYAAHLALWAQNDVCLFAVLRILGSSTALVRSIVVLVIFCVFSGWDMVGGAAMAGIDTSLRGLPFQLPADIEWWDYPFQYSSTVTLIFWVPHHALAGWFLVALLLLWERKGCGIAALSMGALMSAFWSPFALMGILPFVVKAGVEALLQHRVRRIDIGASILVLAVFVPIGLYLTSDTSTIGQGFQHIDVYFLVRYTLFIAIEILPFILLNAILGASRQGFSPWTYRLAVACLLAIPFYQISHSNNFGLRASIPALAIMAITTGHRAYEAFAERRWGRCCLVMVVLGLGSLTGADEIWHAMKSDNNGFSTCDFVRAWDQSPYSSQMSNSIYLAHQRDMPRFVGNSRALTTAPSARRCVDERL